MRATLEGDDRLKLGDDLCELHCACRQAEKRVAVGLHLMTAKVHRCAQRVRKQ